MRAFQQKEQNVAIKANGPPLTVPLHLRMNECRFRITPIKLWFRIALEERAAATSARYLSKQTSLKPESEQTHKTYRHARGSRDQGHHGSDGLKSRYLRNVEKKQQGFEIFEF